MTLALFGTEFVEAGSLLQILIWGSIPLFLINIPTQALMAANLALPLARVYGVSVAVNIVVNLLLIPRWGAGGAAVATVLCEWLNLVLVIRLVRREFAVSLAYTGLWRYGVACAAMLMALWLVQDYGLIAEILVGAFAYSGGLMILGYLRRADMLAIRRLLTQ